MFRDLLPLTYIFDTLMGHIRTLLDVVLVVAVVVVVVVGSGALGSHVRVHGTDLAPQSSVNILHYILAFFP